MGSGFFNKNISAACEYCKNGTAFSGGKEIFCKKKGVVEKGFHCRSFDYDPLLRTPRPKAPELPKFDPEEFKI